MVACWLCAKFSETPFTAFLSSSLSSHQFDFHASNSFSTRATVHTVRPRTGTFACLRVLGLACDTRSTVSLAGTSARLCCPARTAHRPRPSALKLEHPHGYGRVLCHFLARRSREQKLDLLAALASAAAQWTRSRIFRTFRSHTLTRRSHWVS
jgi:hypothetical protein